MKPGYLRLPTIWRGCSWQAVTLTWTDEDGHPINCSGWTPRAYTRKFNLNAALLDPPSAGKTRLVLGPLQTTPLPLGVHDWDFVWLQTGSASNTAMQPTIKGQVEVRDPVTDPDQPVLGRIGGGSVYVRVIPGTGGGISNFCLIGNYDWTVTDSNGKPWDIRPTVNAQLQQMYDNGQRQISLVLWFVKPVPLANLPNAERRHHINGEGGHNHALVPVADWYDPDGTPNGAHLWPQHQQNLLDIMQQIKRIGFKQVKIGYAPQGLLPTSQWHVPDPTPEDPNHIKYVWMQDRFVMIRNFMLSVTRLLDPRRGTLKMIYDLGGEAINEMIQPLPPNHKYYDRNQVHRQYLRWLWRSFYNEFGPNRTNAFGVLGGTYERTKWWLDMLKQYNLPYPRYFRTEGYDDAPPGQRGHILVYRGLTEVYQAMKDHDPAQDDKPIIIGETFYNNATVATQIHQALQDFPGINLAGLRQWPIVYGTVPGSAFPDVFPRNYFNYRTI